MDSYRPIRLLLTRMEKGPELEEIIKFLGKEETIRRLSQDKDWIILMYKYNITLTKTYEHWNLIKK